MLNIIPKSPEDPPRFEAKLLGVIQFQPETDKSIAPSNALALLTSTTTVEAETSQYEHEEGLLIVANGS